jgi:hypothetical protein
MPAGGVLDADESPQPACPDNGHGKSIRTDGPPGKLEIT